MAVSAPHGYVTHRNWGVSVTTGTGILGAVLHVYRLGSRVHGDADGRRFASRDQAFAFAASRGYNEPYFRSHASWKAQHRALSREIAQRIHSGVLAAQTFQEILDLADAAKAEVIAHGCDLLEASAFYNAAHWVARKVRPGLVPGFALSSAKRA